MLQEFKPIERAAVLNRRGSEQRRQVAVAGILEACKGPQVAYVLNVSALGAMVQTGHVADPESGVSLRCGPLDTVAKVVWQQDDRMGLAFDRPIHEEQILELRRRAYCDNVVGKASGRGRAISSRPLTPVESAVAEDWVRYSHLTKPAKETHK